MTQADMHIAAAVYPETQVQYHSLMERKRDIRVLQLKPRKLSPQGDIWELHDPGSPLSPRSQSAGGSSSRRRLCPAASPRSRSRSLAAATPSSISRIFGHPDVPDLPGLHTAFSQSQVPYSSTANPISNAAATIVSRPWPSIRTLDVVRPQEYYSQTRQSCVGKHLSDRIQSSRNGRVEQDLGVRAVLDDSVDEVLAEFRILRADTSTAAGQFHFLHPVYSLYPDS